MKLVMQVKLLPDAATQAALRETLTLCNRAANHASRRAFTTGVKGKTSLQRLVYGELKAMGLSAQPAIHAIRKVAGAYATLNGNLKAGNYGPQGSKRRAAVESSPVRFRKDAAQPFDDRCLSWQLDARTVSIWTVRGRLGRIPFACSPAQLDMLTRYRRGESDLVFRGGAWYLYATCEAPVPDVYDPDGFLGVDLGIANIATTSDGIRHAGRQLNQVRHRNRRLRSRLQAKGTKSAKRLLRRRSGREARFAADTNHRIAKSIVTEAERTCRGIALEDLGGIRERVRLRKPQRVTLHSWAFHQLGTFIAYKAQRRGVPVVYVDPAYTSKGCSVCGHIDKRNRPDQATFACTSCGFAEHADVNAARNIAARGVAGWAVSHAAHDAA
ncbi:RNA-guided endonuclease InsQ/TnpB family protein [Microtetraspora fusca]|uniref:RNA-guided endonuclease InsQ/TnpB family protein n=1 Tax=Microtetraspora fusca TaxID=1997 RepID=UPI00082C9B45|nr:RNA-guided endonuclease TnpB family protein [Microtetraspora fusca]